MDTTNTATMALSSMVVTPFGYRLTSSEQTALDEAQAQADTNGGPCGVWARDGWYTVCDVAPEMIEPDPTLVGWALWAVVDPV